MAKKGKTKADSKESKGDKFSGWDGVVDEGAKEAEGVAEKEVVNTVDVTDVEISKDDEIKAPEVDAPDKLESKVAEVELKTEPPKASVGKVRVKFLKKCPRLWIINGYVEAEEEEIKEVTEAQSFILRSQKMIA